MYLSGASLTQKGVQAQQIVTPQRKPTLFEDSHRLI